MASSGSAMEKTPSHDPAPPARSWPVWAAFCLLIAASSALFARAFDAPLVFDDLHSINQVGKLEHWTGAFLPDAFTFFRPVKNLFFYLVQGAGGQAYQYHLVTLAAYHLATLGVFVFARRMTGRPWFGLATAAVWALAAVNTTQAVWASCFNVSVAAAAMTFALTAWDRWRETPGRTGAAVGFFAWLALALLSYETAIATAPLAVLVDLYRGRPVFRKDSLARYAAIALVVIAYLAVRAQFDSSFSRIANPSYTSDTERWQVAASAPFFLWSHFLMWLAPWGRLEFLGSYIWDRSIPALILPFCWIFLIGLIALGVRRWKPGNLFWFGLAWFLVVAFPSGNFIPLKNTPYADYYVPLPAIGLALAAVTLADRALKSLRSPETGPGIRALAAVVFVAIVGSRAANLPALVTWAEAWRKPVVLMARTAAARPHQYYAKATAAAMMFESGDIESARRFSASAIEDTPELALPYLILGRIAEKNGNDDEALHWFNESLDHRHLIVHSLSETHHHLAKLLGKSPENFDAALPHYLFALGQHDYEKHVDVILDAADLHVRAGKLDDAITILNRGLGYHPGDPRLSADLEKIRTQQAAKS